MILKKIKFLICLLASSLFAQDHCPPLLNATKEARLLGEVRVKAIRGWDRLLTWALSPRNPPYTLISPLEEKLLEVSTQEILNFGHTYGYFSTYHPIVGIVTKDLHDIEITKCLLRSLHEELVDPTHIRFASDEVLGKVLSYRSLKTGMEISISSSTPEGKKVLTEYVVDVEIDLWHGMPAFGLRPVKKGQASPILLFRGTDLSITSERGWASILSDLDTAGPGHTTFLRAQAEIRKWLEKMSTEGQSARAVGFSLGGVFALYTMIYNSDLMSHDPDYPSVAISPPGLSKEVLAKWKQIPGALQPSHIIYVALGDFISQIGFFPEKVWEMSQEPPMQVIEAHATLMSTLPKLRLRAVNMSLENELRQKRP